LIVVYCEYITPRHEYIIPYILESLCGFRTRLTADIDDYTNSEDQPVNYSEKEIRSGEIHILPSGLLDQHGMTSCTGFIDRDNEAFHLYIDGDGIKKERFDPFSAAFYLLSRYEEYFDYQADEFGRFEAAACLQFNFDLLEEPLVNRWAKELKAEIQNKYPSITPESRSADEIVSIDIDQAYAFRNRGIKRNLLALAKNISLFKTGYLGSQLKTMLLRRKDPFDTYNYLSNIRNEKDLKMVFFVNLGSYSRYDKNLNVSNRAFKRLLNKLAVFTAIGIHPSYYSSEKPELLHHEKEALEKAISKPVTKSRQHFLRMKLPHTYKDLIHAGITEDFTMGFASRPGFRAGCCTPFKWFDLQKNTETELTVFPITYMDGTLAEDMKLSPSAALEKISTLIETVKKYNGCLLSIWHNHTVNDAFAWKGWKTIFEKSINRLKD
jgi:hypothetical protein